jgi:hypothetical protein
MELDRHQKGISISHSVGTAMATTCHARDSPSLFAKRARLPRQYCAACLLNFLHLAPCHVFNISIKLFSYCENQQNWSGFFGSSKSVSYNSKYLNFDNFLKIEIRKPYNKLENRAVNQKNKPIFCFSLKN